MELHKVFVILPTALFLLFVIVDGRLFCFRRLKKRGKCGGVLRKSRFSSPQDCCAGKGQGFADRKIKLGRNRFRCTPCSDLGPPTTVTVASVVYSTQYDPEPTRKPEVQTTTFSWPKPYAKKQGEYYEHDERSTVEWEEWSPCSVSCGAGWRSRAIVCDGCDRNDYENVQSQPCMVNFYCPVDGNWGPWYPWESCTTTCGTGTRTRNRKCNYPPPAYGGARCAGDAVATDDCTKKQCPVDGSWGEWGGYSECSATCGPGTTRKTRSCDSPLPQFGGKDCAGPDSQAKRCEIVKCPVNGGWSLWSSWTLCSATCGHGVKERTRSCDSPRPQHGGEKCEGASTHHTQCYGGRPCPVDGGWSEWTNYGFCRAPRCGRGYQIRSRACTKPRPAHGGKPCTGQQYERVSCVDDHDCPVNGSWCEWTQWNTCSATCREDSPLQARQRVCACPKQRNGGAECNGDSFQVQDCKGVTLCKTQGEDMSEDMDGSGSDEMDDEEAETEMAAIANQRELNITSNQPTTNLTVTSTTARTPGHVTDRGTSSGPNSERSTRPENSATSSTSSNKYESSQPSQWNSGSENSSSKSGNNHGNSGNKNSTSKINTHGNKSGNNQGNSGNENNTRKVNNSGNKSSTSQENSGSIERFVKAGSGGALPSSKSSVKTISSATITVRRGNSRVRVRQQGATNHKGLQSDNNGTMHGGI